MFRMLDLFSGIGGFSLAASWVWGNELEIVSFCEIDPFCQRVLRKHWPNVPCIEDIRDVTREKVMGYAKCAGLRKPYDNSKLSDGVQQKSLYGCGVRQKRSFAIDLLTGGFPCQPFSCAGKRQGKEDNRFLWPEMLRVIQEVKPAWVIAENVSGLLSINGGLEFEHCCASLEAEGYEVQPFIIPACAKNAPHRRDRVWIVAHGFSKGLEIGSMQRGVRGSKTEAPERESTVSQGEDVAHPAQWQDNGRERGIVEGEERTGRGFDSTAHACCEDVGNSEFSRLSGNNGWRSKQKSTDGCEDVADTENTNDQDNQGRQRQMQSGGNGGAEHRGQSQSRICRMVDGLSQRLDGGGLNEQGGIEKTSATGNFAIWEAMRKMWVNREAIKTPSDLRGRNFPDTLLGLPCGGRFTGWHSVNEEDEEMRGLRERVFSSSFKEAQHLFPRLLERIRENQRKEAMEPWRSEPRIARVATGVRNRVDRLRALGNAIVPQVAAEIMLAIKEAGS